MILNKEWLQMKQKRNTLQKGIVFDVFREMHNHPSAGMVYEAVHAKYPEISKATVYRLLAEAAEEGDLLRLKLAGSDDRYDVTLARHYHIVCRCCGAVADVSTAVDDEMLLKATQGYESFTVDGIHVEFSGFCKKCKDSQKENKN